MADLSPWVGPAIVAAVISALITAGGWYASHVSNRRLDAGRRRERIRDVQTALRAEIRSHRRWLEQFDSETQSGAIVAKIEAPERDADFTPFVPREADTFIFNSVVKEIHILPSGVIDPVVLYYRQIQALARFADDLRSDRFETLESARKAAMYRDYVALGVYALDLADETIETINRSLDTGVQ